MASPTGQAAAYCPHLVGWTPCKWNSVEALYPYKLPAGYYYRCKSCNHPFPC